ncbi:T9SS type A sorting domain-containing protein (plasmid) [Chryseobacterium chendengshani]|uniref:T9SS-dependent choice-of-anchor J family protein n=1 Tax=Chryseobacterium sp. LJ668 TaxID=2864040 RepID=UPI001C68C883|nr:choice-of-anchor J domain-containing protein [Chryseobacterium sp. LJ668]MBW8521980.1 T9SS type A sorting domain-containing protein [Chryseobacterium sp. LJ668]QYK17635.1 T9SS type A sorting domain-containing protein [Chryseobacterium sp. LJ668]QYK18161.1 T9SS type A sorting domain-containing protein [Chryseobacterium sp. LJ668]QYK18169.1 T9SS type A sorting domain-containing protein [Chryseobacterium sp. LJ668]
MKKLLLSALALTISVSAYSQTLLDESFESYTNFAITGFGGWQTLDLDLLNTYTGGGPVVGGSTIPSWTAGWANAGQPMAFQIFNLSASNATNNATATATDEEVRNFSAHTGQKTAVSWAGVPAAGVTSNNDWLISPAITLGASNNILTLWVKALSPAFVESYKIGVYVGSGTPTSAANFTIISGAAALTAPFTWQQATQSLNAYSGQTIRIGIQYMSSDKYMFMVDDVKVTTGTLSTDEVSKSKTSSIYPNPTKGEINIKTDKKIKSSTVFDLSGKVLLQTDSQKVNIGSFTKGTYLLKVEFADGSTKTEKVIKD